MQKNPFFWKDVEQLAEKVSIYRSGNIRVLRSNGASISTLRDLTLPQIDRPNGDSNGILNCVARIGTYSITSGGSIALKYYTVYGDPSSITDIPGTWTLNFSIVWGVD